MNEFDSRKNAFLKEHELNEEQKFKIRSIANKKLAIWVADLCGLNEAQQKQLTMNFIEKDIIQTGQGLVAQAAAEVLQQHGKHQSLETIEEKIIALTSEAALEAKEKNQ